MIIKSFLIFVLLIVVVDMTCAQPYLILRKEGTRRRSVYQKGDILSFRLKNDKQRKNLEIKELYADTIVFKGGPVTIDEIGAVYIKADYRNWNPATYTYFLVIAGTGYAGLAAVNDRKVGANTIATSSALVASGLIIHFLKQRKVKIKNKVKLEILEEIP